MLPVTAGVDMSTQHNHANCDKTTYITQISDQTIGGIKHDLSHTYRAPVVYRADS